MNLRSLKAGPNLRAKVIGILAGGTILVTIAAGVLVLVARQSDQLLDRASVAQRHLELLILLSGRISDYGLSLLETAQEPQFDTARLIAGKARVDDMFSSIDQVISDQVGLLSVGDAQSAMATKSLNTARMKARFNALHRQVTSDALANADPSRRTDNMRSAMNAFGVHFAPQLAQAVEDQRAEVSAARREMSQLRRRANLFAIIWALTAVVGSGLLYWLAGRPILSRISQTISGASEISSGRLERRLKPAGHDELTLLMTKFNRMADSFSRRERKLLDLQTDLQQTVDARTSDLVSANERLEEIDINRKRFFSDISHELRTPLTVIIGEAEVSLRQPAGLDGETKTSLETILARARSLRRRVDDLLRVARSESGRLDLDLAHTDAVTVVEEAVSETMPLASAHGISMDVAKPARQVTANCDREWLRQSVSGLLANAIKHSPADTVVSVTVEKAEDAVVIEVKDQGEGIAAADMPQIFNRFYRGKDPSDAKAGGFGMGLALIKWVIEEHGGTITAHSTRNDGADATKAGSTFTIRLPSTPA